MKKRLQQPDQNMPSLKAANENIYNDAGKVAFAIDPVFLRVDFAALLVQAGPFFKTVYKRMMG